MHAARTDPHDFGTGLRAYLGLEGADDDTVADAAPEGELCVSETQAPSATRYDAAPAGAEGACVSGSQAPEVVALPEQPQPALVRRELELAAREAAVAEREAALAARAAALVAEAQALYAAVAGATEDELEAARRRRALRTAG